MLQLGEQEECLEGVVAAWELSVAVEYKKKTKSKAKRWSGQIFFCKNSNFVSLIVKQKSFISSRITFFSTQEKIEDASEKISISVLLILLERLSWCV